MQADIQAVHGFAIGEILGNLYGEEIKPNLTFSDDELMDLSFLLKKKLSETGDTNPLDVPGVFTLQDGCYEMPITARVTLCVSQETVDDGKYRKMWLKIPFVK